MKHTNNKLHWIEFQCKIKKGITLKRIFNARKKVERESSFPLLAVSLIMYKGKFRTFKMPEMNHDGGKTDCSGTTLNLKIILKNERFQI